MTPTDWNDKDQVLAHVTSTMGRQEPWPLFPGRWRRIVCRIRGHRRDPAYLPPRCGHCGRQLR